MTKEIDDIDTELFALDLSDDLDFETYKKGSKSLAEAAAGGTLNDLNGPGRRFVEEILKQRTTLEVSGRSYEPTSVTLLPDKSAARVEFPKGEAIIDAPLFDAHKAIMDTVDPEKVRKYAEEHDLTDI